MGTLQSIGFIFMSSIQKNRRILPRARQSFHFQKITGTLKMMFLKENLQKPYAYFRVTGKIF